jgi:hypothetical protein
MNLLAALPRIDLTDRDFSDCVMPYAYLYKRDLTGSKDLKGVVLIVIFIILEIKIIFLLHILWEFEKLIFRRVVLKIVYYYAIKRNNV